ncbi:DUF4174 domain-containing protein [Photobacterium sp. MCCC 1A19761]|uniref:DUF4174 domain-containing protein n=1 Tax=Photobacterium sp. MCCC 1A19761 TaxID=3115000 RepID=UPI00307CCDF1
MKMIPQRCCRTFTRHALPLSALCCLALFFGTWLATAPVARAYPPDSLHWHHRSILYFAPQYDQHVQAFQREVLMNDCLLQERDVVTIVITHDGFNQPANLFSPEDIQMLTQKYNIAPDAHTAILIGKDGKEKHRWSEVTNWRYLTELIDSMPLRQQEMAMKTSRCAI